MTKAENRSERKGFTMIRYVKVDDELLAKAKEFTGIENTPELIQDSIRTLILRKEASRRLAECMNPDYSSNSARLDNMPLKNMNKTS